MEFPPFPKIQIILFDCNSMFRPATQRKLEQLNSFCINIEKENSWGVPQSYITRNLPFSGKQRSSHATLGLVVMWAKIVIFGFILWTILFSTKETKKKSLTKSCVKLVSSIIWNLCQFWTYYMRLHETKNIFFSSFKLKTTNERFLLTFVINTHTNIYIYIYIYIYRYIYIY